MIDELGYLKLMGIGIAKRLLVDKKSFTTIGIPFYMVPEVIMSFFSKLCHSGTARKTRMKYTR